MQIKKETPSINPYSEKTKQMSDEELFDELRGVVNSARNTQTWNRELARAIGEECAKRRWFKRMPSLIWEK